MDILKALVLMWVVHFVITSLDKSPAQTLHEVIDEAKRVGFFHSVFGAHPLSRVLGFLLVTAFGVLVGKWWLGAAAVVADVVLGIMTWFFIVRREVKS